MSKKTKTKVEEPIVDVVDVEPVVEVVEEKPLVGVVSNCTKLNIRSKPAVKADEPNVVCVVSAGTELIIDESKSNNKWYKVSTADGKEGFCMKDFVTVK